MTSSNVAGWLNKRAKIAVLTGKTTEMDGEPQHGALEAPGGINDHFTPRGLRAHVLHRHTSDPSLPRLLYVRTVIAQTAA